MGRGVITLAVLLTWVGSAGVAFASFPDVVPDVRPRSEGPSPFVPNQGGDSDSTTRESTPTESSTPPTAEMLSLMGDLPDFSADTPAGTVDFRVEVPGSLDISVIATDGGAHLMAGLEAATGLPLLLITGDHCVGYDALGGRMVRITGSTAARFRLAYEASTEPDASGSLKLDWGIVAMPPDPDNPELQLDLDLRSFFERDQIDLSIERSGRSVTLVGLMDDESSVRARWVDQVFEEFVVSQGPREVVRLTDWQLNDDADSPQVRWTDWGDRFIVTQRNWPEDLNQRQAVVNQVVGVQRRSLAVLLSLELPAGGEQENAQRRQRRDQIESQAARELPWNVIEARIGVDSEAFADWWAEARRPQSGA